MPFDRFYLQNPFSVGSQVFLEGNEHHHLAHVMRISVGEEIELVNGEGALARALLVQLDKKKALLEIKKVEQIPRKPPQILLAIPFLRAAKLEWVLEKGAELNVDSFLLYPADLGEKKELSAHQLERLHSLLISSMKQSGRLFLPHLECAAQFSDLFKKEAFFLYGDTRSAAPLLDRVDFPVVFVSGPESGFSQREHELLEQKGQGVKLSRFILRAETAPLAAAALLSWKSEKCGL